MFPLPSAVRFISLEVDLLTRNNYYTGVDYGSKRPFSIGIVTQTAYTGSRVKETTANHVLVIPTYRVTRFTRYGDFEVNRSINLIIMMVIIS